MRCTCTETQVYPQKPQSPCVDCWWFYSSLQLGLAPAFAAATGRHSWSRTSPSDNTNPQGSPQLDGLSVWRPGNHLWDARVTIWSNGGTCGHLFMVWWTHLVSERCACSEVGSGWRRWWIPRPCHWDLCSLLRAFCWWDTPELLFCILPLWVSSSGHIGRNQVHFVQNPDKHLADSYTGIGH